MLDLGASVTADNVAQTLQHFTRTPAETIELVWKPNIADTEFNDPTETGALQIKDRKSAMTVAWAGLPAATGIIFHFTAVYEWTPTIGQGIGHNALGKAISRNSLDDVIDTLIQNGFSFVRGAGEMAARTLGRAAISGISRAFGTMPAVPNHRSLAY